MQRTMMKSKIHRATVTAADIDYEGSVTVDSALLAAADIMPHEQVHLLDITNGSRLTTYAIPGDEGVVCVNGAAAMKVDVGDLVIILSYGIYATAELDDFQPRVIRVDGSNRITAADTPLTAPGAAAGSTGVRVTGDIR